MSDVSCVAVEHQDGDGLSDRRVCRAEEISMQRFIVGCR